MGYDVNSYGYYNDSGAVFNNGSTIDTYAPFGNINDNISFALDVANAKFWVRVNGGNWNNSGLANPATNTGGLAFSLTTPIYPAFIFRSGNGAFSTTANFISSSWLYSAPAGFSALPVPVAGVVQNYLFPGAVQPQKTAPAVLSYTKAFPGIAFLQHKFGQTTTVQSYVYPGAVQPTAMPPAIILTPALYSDPDTFFAPALSFLQFLTPSLYSDPDSFSLRL